MTEQQDEQFFTEGARKTWTLFFTLLSILAYFVLAGIVFQFIWNVGIVALVVAAGGTLALISLKAAIASYLGFHAIWWFIHKTFHQHQPVNNIMINNVKEDDERASSD